MKIKTSLVALAILASFAVAAVAQQGKGSNQGEPAKPTASSQAVESLATAASLVRYGDAHKDALSLITAARIMSQVGSSDSKAEVVAVNPGEKKADKASTEAILARAKQYAGSRADLVALANDVAASGSRGATGGPGRKTTVVSRGTADVYRVRFNGNEPAMVLASGDGDSDLDLYVLDENGNTVCKDEDTTDTLLCRWTPKWSGVFTIRVKNLGMANQYTLVHN
ncbi:hypothetical protein [Rhodoferax antarcticus]|uniref:hypothetical protein n=1 Tax=Rhodoferax antarcticus TaxID=81479 RepID=UPI002224E8FB|nr:hypothetical protein [Rhodoferax antarcticus]MCW2314353.1 hypothetical protein [Rhodoferax antarcticus]